MAFEFLRGRSGRYNVSIANLVESLDQQSNYCAVVDLLSLERKVSRGSFPFDVLVAGVKMCDRDPVFGQMHCPSDIQESKGSADFAFPIRKWSDKDIFQYTIAKDVPYQKTRYLLGDETFTERKNTTHNPDHLNCCTRCLNPVNGQTFLCPKTGSRIQNRAFLITDLKIGEMK